MSPIEMVTDITEDCGPTCQLQIAGSMVTLMVSVNSLALNSCLLLVHEYISSYTLSGYGYLIFTDKTSVCFKKTWDGYCKYNIGMCVSWQWIMILHEKQYFHEILVVETNMIITELYWKRQSFLFTHNFYVFVWLYFLIVTINTFWVDMSFWESLLIHWGQGMHICISELGHHWFR